MDDSFRVNLNPEEGLCAVAADAVVVACRAPVVGGNCTPGCEVRWGTSIGASDVNHHGVPSKEIICKGAC